VLTPATSGIGYLLVLTGVPVYLWWKRAGLGTERQELGTRD